MLDSREKGKRAEREAVELIKNITGAEWRRTPMSGAMHLDFPWDVSKRPGQQPTWLDEVGIEVKNCKNIKMPDWIKQCEEAGRDYTGIVQYDKYIIFYKHRMKWHVDMPLEQLMRFIKH